MKNKIFLLFFFYLLSSNAHSLDQFNFDVTELKILENGYKINPYNLYFNLSDKIKKLI